MPKSLTVKPIPVSGVDHPPPPHEVLPRHEFSMGFIGTLDIIFTIHHFNLGKQSSQRFRKNDSFN